MVKPNDRQVAGSHYGGHEHQHWDFCWERGYDQFQYAISKYVERWKIKNGVVDLEKALHYAEKYMEVLQVASDDVAMRSNHTGWGARYTQNLDAYVLARRLDEAQAHMLLLIGVGGSRCVRELCSILRIYIAQQKALENNTPGPEAA